MAADGTPAERQWSRWLPLAVGAVALAVTAGLWRHEQRSTAQALRADFDAGVRQTAGRVEQRLESYEQMLRGVQGLVQASPDGAHALDAYVDALQAGADFTGVDWFARVAWQPGEGAHGGRSRIAAVAPVVGLNQRALGDDPLADPVRGPALMLACDSGSLAITPRLRRLVDADASAAADASPGFLMVLPVYAAGQALDSVAARRAALRGWVMAAVRMNDLMASLYGEVLPGVQTRIYDGVDASDQALMAAPPGAPVAQPLFDVQEYLGFAGHAWTMRVQAGPEFAQRRRDDAARIIVLAGLSLGLLLALLTRQLVTARQRAHDAALRMTEALRASEERYRRIVETADEGIWVTDAEGRTTFVNPKMAQMLGCPADALLGRRTEAFIDTATLAAEGGAGPGAREQRLRRVDGSTLWALVASTPVTDSAGRLQGTLAMVTDISHRKQAEAARAGLEAQLRASQKMEAIGTLAGGIAHDFNNILAAILGNVALAQQAALDGAARQRLAQISQSAERARSLVQQILAFSRRQPHSLRPQALAPVVEESVRLLRPILPAMVELELRQGGAPLGVRADATQLHQVLMNLCTNAWHALQGLAGRIEIALDRGTLDAATAQRLGLAPGSYARLSVADTGCGMDEATRQRLFEPFFTTKPVGQGTGLGLAVVHGIVSAHGGVIDVHSRPGAGSRFELYFPLLPDAEAAPAGPRPPAAPAAPPVSPAAGRHVVYIDDDPVMVMMVEGLLQHAGYRVSTWDDPRAALDALRRRPDEADLVLTDFNMPGLSGLDVAEALAALRPGLPVVISSGYVTEDLLAAAGRAGVRRVLQKEFTLEQLPPLLLQVFAEAAQAGR
ncbi:MAG: CHASE domain-containing protein [Burkholderiaceae bacterium]